MAQRDIVDKLRHEYFCLSFIMLLMLKSVLLMILGGEIGVSIKIYWTYHRYITSSRHWFSYSIHHIWHVGLDDWKGKDVIFEHKGTNILTGCSKTFLMPFIIDQRLYGIKVMFFYIVWCIPSCLNILSFKVEIMALKDWYLIKNKKLYK